MQNFTATRSNEPHWLDHNLDSVSFRLTFRGIHNAGTAWLKPNGETFGIPENWLSLPALVVDRANNVSEDLVNEIVTACHEAMEEVE